MEVLLLLHNRGFIMKNVPVRAALCTVRGYDFRPLRDLESQNMSPTILQRGICRNTSIRRAVVRPVSSD